MRLDQFMKRDFNYRLESLRRGTRMIMEIDTSGGYRICHLDLSFCTLGLVIFFKNGLIGKCRNNNYYSICRCACPPGPRIFFQKGSAVFRP